MILTKNFCLGIIQIKNKSLCGGIMKKIKNRKTTKFKFSKYKVIRNFTVIIILGLIFFSLKSQAYSKTYKTIIVSQGQTLWDIAKEENKNNEYYQNKDIRYIINDIKNINNLENSTIFINQKLKIIEK